ncbi:MAG: ectoine/hydroxyectoine ABC transporter permease subunit EhuC [Myxococcales bacterium]
MLQALLPGLWVTLQIYLGAAAIVLVITVVLGVARGCRLAPLRWASGLYIQAFRGLPALVLLFWFFYSLPGLGLSVGPQAAAVLALGLNFGAYGAELMRGAIAAVPQGQTEAAIALGFSPAQRMRRIVLPQAFVHLLPPFGNLNIELLKNTALASFIGLADLTFQGKLLQTATQRTVEIFGLVLTLYFLLALCITAAVRSLEHIFGRGLRPDGEA